MMDFFRNILSEYERVNNKSTLTLTVDVASTTPQQSSVSLASVNQPELSSVSRIWNVYIFVTACQTYEVISRRHVNLPVPRWRLYHRLLDHISQQPLHYITSPASSPLSSSSSSLSQSLTACSAVLIKNFTA